MINTNIKIDEITNDYDENRISIILFLTSVCNFNCSYCNIKLNEKIYIDNLVISNLKKFIIDNFNHKNVTIYLFGGEPTLHKKLLPIIKYLNLPNVCFYIQTNGFGLTLKQLKYLKLKKINVEIGVSLHLEQKQLSDYIKRINLYKKFFKTEVSFVVTLHNSHYVKLIKKFFNDCAFYIDTNNLNEILSAIPWTKTLIGDEFKIKFNNSKFSIVSPALLHFYNLDHYFQKYTCSSGINKFVIDWNGLVFRCLSLKMNTNDIIGDFKKSPKIKKINPICNFDGACVCPMKIKISRLYN